MARFTIVEPLYYQTYRLYGLTQGEIESLQRQGKIYVEEYNRINKFIEQGFTVDTILAYFKGQGYDTRQVIEVGEYVSKVKTQPTTKIVTKTATTVVDAKQIKVNNTFNQIEKGAAILSTLLSSLGIGGAKSNNDGWGGSTDIRTGIGGGGMVTRTYQDGIEVNTGIVPPTIPPVKVDVEAQIQSLINTGYIAGSILLFIVIVVVISLGNSNKQNLKQEKK